MFMNVLSFFNWKSSARGNIVIILFDMLLYQINSFFLAISESGELYLKTDHHYMHQIQGCMHLVNASKCYFVVWTLKSIEVILVFRDPIWNLFFITVSVEVKPNYYLKLPVRIQLYKEI